MKPIGYLLNNEQGMYKHAYSLLQIIFSMAIIAVLVALSLTGIAIFQQSNRDATRKNTLSDLVNVLAEYNRNNLSYPSGQDVQFQTNSFTVQGIELYQLDGPAKAGAETTSGFTRYYYARTSGGYALCAELESGAIQSVGEDDCPDPTQW